MTDIRAFNNDGESEKCHTKKITSEKNYTSRPSNYVRSLESCAAGNIWFLPRDARSAKQ